ncbi:hypothetical protein N431DRAFT_435493 [Stipitochalara longipes BDJ]|nr:hypothetical protein N431DRAFT_435493 [Stipitochalara longipes BDJ]
MDGWIETRHVNGYDWNACFGTAFAPPTHFTPSLWISACKLSNRNSYFLHREEKLSPLPPYLPSSITHSSMHQQDLSFSAPLPLPPPESKQSSTHPLPGPRPSIRTLARG